MRALSLYVSIRNIYVNVPSVAVLLDNDMYMVRSRIRHGNMIPWSCKHRSLSRLSLQHASHAWMFDTYARCLADDVMTARSCPCMHPTATFMWMYLRWLYLWCSDTCGIFTLDKYESDAMIVHALIHCFIVYSNKTICGKPANVWSMCM